MSDLIFLFSLWRSVSEKPKFWRWAALRVDGTNQSAVVSSKIIHCVSTIRICTNNDVSPCFIETLLMLIADGKISQLKKLCPNKANLSSVDPELLSQAAVNIEELERIDCALTLPQLLSLFSKIIESQDLKLKMLDISASVLSEVPPSVLARAALSLVSFRGRSLKSEQIHEILTKIVEEGSTLRTKNLHIFENCSLETVSSETLAAALVRLESTYIKNSNDLSDDKINCLFNKIAVSPIVNIIQLDLSPCQSVDPEVFADALIRVEESVQTYMTEDQATALFRRIAGGQNIRIKRLFFNSIDLSHISADDMSEAVVNLELVDLTAANLREGQVQDIFKKIISAENLILKVLDLGENDLFDSEGESSEDLSEEEVSSGDLFESEGVYSDDLVRAISRLEEVNLTNTSLSEDHVRAIFNMVAEGRAGKLRRIVLGDMDHDDLSEDLRERAEMNEEVELDYAIF